MTNDFKKEVARYALLDTKATYMLWQQFAEKMPDREWRISAMTRQMGMRGVPVNMDRLIEARDKLIAEKRRAEALLPWIGGEYPPLSLQAIRDQCEKEGIRAPKSFAEKDPEGAAWEAEFADKFPWVRAVRDYRKANKHLNTVTTMIARTRPDGRMPYELKFFGATTGRDSGGGGWNCMTGDHEVLTPDGWVTIESWNPKRPIMQFKEDGILEFCVAEKVELNHDGQMIEIDGPRVRGLFTPSHRVVYHRRGKLFEVPAESLLTKNQDYIPTAGDFTHAESDLNDDELCLLVAVAADGHVTPKGQITFGFRKQRKIDRLTELLASSKIPYHSKIKPDGVTSFAINKCDVPTWLNKGISDWVLSLSPKQAEIVIDELSEWDGEKNARSGQVTFFTSKREEALWAATLGHLHGIACSVNYYARTDGSRGRYIVYFTRGKTTQIKNGSGSISVVQKPYAGKVYCAKVPSGAFLIRYKDRIHVTGNCQNIPKGEVAGVDIRKLIEAPAGKTLVICDLAQIEARCLPYLAKDRELLDLIESGLDVYEAHARATMGYDDPRPLKEVDPKLRQVAKARVLGAGYGVGPEKFQLVAKIMAGLDITLQEAQETVQAYRDSNPKIVAYWKKFDRELRKATDPNDRELIVELPSKRVLTYRNVRRQAGGIIGLLPRLGKMMNTNLYGAKIVENLCQAFARDVFMDRCIALEDAGYEILLRVHDEVVLLVDESDAETHRAAVEKIMSTPPSWCSDLPLGAEAIISKQYTK